MKKMLAALVSCFILAALIIPASAMAHSGRTDSSGGHNCSEKSKAKGLCTGYHYHNGGSNNSGSSSSSGSSSTTKAAKVKVISNEYPAAPHCKKIEDKYKSSDASYEYYERIWDCNYYTESGLVYKQLELKLYVNDKRQTLVKPLISIKDTSYMSVRDFSQVFGYSIEIDKAGDVILKKDSAVIKIVHANNEIFVNEKSTDVKADKADGSYYIPVRSAMKWVGGSITSVDRENLYVTIS